MPLRFLRIVSMWFSALDCLFRSSAFSFSGAFVVSWIQSWPRSQMPGCWESTHIQTNFGKDNFRTAPPDSRDLLQFLDCFLISLHLFIDDMTKRAKSSNELLNEQTIEWIKALYIEENGILGCRQMTTSINRIHNTTYNVKRIRRLMRALQLQSVCRKKRYNYTPSTPEITAENILNREFYADKPNEKWLTDVTEFKWHEGPVVHKLYLSAIFDLYDRRIVTYKIGTSNNNKLAFDTFDEAVAQYPDAHPLFHSDRGFQYTRYQKRLRCMTPMEFHAAA